MKIKSQEIFVNYYVIAGINAKELEEKTFCESRMLRDENGNITQHAKYTLPKGEIESLVKMKYDARGNKTEEVHYISEEEISERKTFKWDDKNLLVAEYLHYLDGSFDTTFFIYDEKNMLIETKTVDSENQIELRREHHCENGLLSEIISFDADENISGKEIYKYNEKGNIIEKIIVSEDESEEKVFYEYDDSNRKTKIIQQNRFEKAETHFHYDSKGNICEEKLLSGENLLRSVVFAYDEKNILKEIQEFVPAAGITPEQKLLKSVEYEFY